MSDIAYNSFVIGLERTYSGPMVKNELFASLTEAEQYATTNPTAYAGQKLSVVEGGQAVGYIIQPDKTLKKEGGEIEWKTLE